MLESTAHSRMVFVLPSMDSLLWMELDTSECTACIKTSAVCIYSDSCADTRIVCVLLYEFTKPSHHDCYDYLIEFICGNCFCNLASVLFLHFMVPE